MSTPPVPYDRQSNFTAFEQQNPTRPKPGTALDAELNAIRATLNAALERLSEIQRDDGALRNELVGPDSLSKDTLVLIGSQLNPRGNWVTATVYNPRDLVQQGGISYIATIAHVATTFSADLALGRWQSISTGSPAASGVSFTPAGAVTATNVQAAIEQVAAAGGGASSPNLTALAGLTLSANTLPYATGPGAMTLTPFTAFGRTLVGAADATSARGALGLSVGVAAGNLVQLDGSARLPAVDASQLANVVVPDLSITAAKLANTLDLSAKAITLPAALTPAFSKSYVSPQQTIAAGGALSLTHGLGELPKIVTAVLVCTTAEHGYSINDQVIVGYGPQNTVDNGIAVIIGTTAVDVKFGAAASSLRVLHKTAGTNQGITNASWRLVIRAYA